MGIVQYNPKYWTYGVEHELGDWDTRDGWDGFGRDPEPNVCNSNGIAADPTLKDWYFGAEINTKPTKSCAEQGNILRRFLKRHTQCFVSQRVGMHIHVRIPGLSRSLPALKRLQKYVCENVDCYNLIDPVPDPIREQYDTEDQYNGARKWVRMIRRSHWTRIPDSRVQKQMMSSSVKEFFAMEAPFTKRTNKPMWHAQPRASVNIRQLMQTDTIEFRHFFGTLSAEHVVNSCRWCRDYLLAWLDKYPATKLFDSKYVHIRFPSRPDYLHWLEKRWEFTSHSKNKRQQIKENIQIVLSGEFDGLPPEGDW